MKSQSNSPIRKYHFKTIQSPQKNKIYTMIKLRKIWTDEHIDPINQNIFQQYLTQLSTITFSSQIQQETKRTISRQSILFKMQKIISERDPLNLVIQQSLKDLKSITTQTERRVNKICPLLALLRSYNHQYACNLLDIHKYFCNKGDKKIFSNMLLVVLNNLHSDNDRLKKSILRKYIVFSNSYDPFLLKHYDLLKKTNNPRLKELLSVEQLFNLQSKKVKELKSTQEQIQLLIKRGQNTIQIKVSEGVNYNTIEFQTLDSKINSYSPNKHFNIGNNPQGNYAPSYGTIGTIKDLRQTINSEENNVDKNMVQNMRRSKLLSLPPIHNSIRVSSQRQGYKSQNSPLSKDKHKNYNFLNIKRNRSLSPEVVNYSSVQNPIKRISQTEDGFKKYIAGKIFKKNVTERCNGYSQPIKPRRPVHRKQYNKQYQGSQEGFPLKTKTEDIQIQTQRQDSYSEYYPLDRVSSPQNYTVGDAPKRESQFQNSSTQRYNDQFVNKQMRKDSIDVDVKSQSNQRSQQNEKNKREDQEQQNKGSELLIQKSFLRQKNRKHVKKIRKQFQNKQVIDIVPDQQLNDEKEKEKEIQKSQSFQKLKQKSIKIKVDQNSEKEQINKNIENKTIQTNQEINQIQSTQSLIKNDEIMQNQVFQEHNHEKPVQKYNILEDHQKNEVILKDSNSCIEQKLETQKMKHNQNDIKYRLAVSQKKLTPEMVLVVLAKVVKIKQSYRIKCQIGNWQNSIKHNQFYLHKSYINDQLLAISLCCSLPQGDINIKYWGPIQKCTQEQSNTLFTKYLQHLQKTTLLKSIYFNALSIRQLPLNLFIKRKQRIFQRQRINPSEVQEFNFTYFLSIKSTNLAVSKETSNQEELIQQSQIQSFTANNFMAFNYLLIINKLVQPGAFSTVCTYHPKLQHLHAVYQRILAQYLSIQPYRSQFSCTSFNLLTLKLQTPIFSAFFTADNQYIKVVGQLCYEEDQSVIICLQMLKHNTKLYFGKGLKNIAFMADKVRQLKRIYNQKVQFRVRMFRKQLRGRMGCINLKEENCYGDLEISFVWKDYLQGAIVHSFKDCDFSFEHNFYCLVQMQKQTLFVFQVLSQNFIN